ncbi:hypothetical protein AVEN_249236-1 [Araneus ventricosus]|uniref:Uncharacterized protein n=1 Tax=Araneus ventricosus TaxID=182803 RepID=A0A4Y2MI24_ARAVE|nr:hypothetical protein AVEN_249236-1 [Araneus ventricosus]
MVSTAGITEAVQNVVDCLINAANNTIPKCSPRLRKFRRPWWNEACCDNRREEKKLWNIFRRYPMTENHVAFKHAKAIARRIRRRSQRESWINFLHKSHPLLPVKNCLKRLRLLMEYIVNFSFLF